MPSIFRRLFTGHGVQEGVGRALEEAAKHVAVAEPLGDEAAVTERAPDEQRGPRMATASIEDTLPRDEHGLIPADQLPSAADVLAELFPEEPVIDPFAEDGRSELEGKHARVEEVEEAPATAPAEAGRKPTQDATAGQPAEPTTDTAAESDGPAAIPAVAADEKPTTDSAELPQASAGTVESAQAEAAATVEPQDSARADEVRPIVGAEASPPTEENEAESRVGDLDNIQQEPEGTSIDQNSAPPEREAEDAEIRKSAAMAAIESPGTNARDWRLEEKLAGHLEWLDSQGRNGLRADLSDADLEGQELIGVKLRLADLHDANLRAADLLLADLRDASLIRADLEDSCLVGANLEAANLEGASLETAMGLVPRQIAGTNLRDALLPPPIMEFEAAGKFARASKIAWRCFVPLIPLVLISWLIVWKTKDTQLLTDSAIIPYLHSHTAAAAMPTAQIFLLAPLVMLGLYLVFQFHLQKVWDAALELPAIFPDGHPLDDRGPTIIVGLLRSHFWWINREHSSTRWVERALSILLAYWAVPFTLTLFWARYLTVQDGKGTLLQTVLVAVSAGVALHATTRTGRKQELWALSRKWTDRLAGRVREVSPAISASVLGVVLLLLSIGTLVGVPHTQSRAPQYGAASIRRWAADVFWTIGFDPYADLTEATLSQKPPGWTGANAQVASVKGPMLNEAKFRYAQAYGVFLANAHLWQSDFEGAYLSEADLRGADLGHSNLRYAVLDGARLTGANLNRARLDGAILARGDLRWANLSYASLQHATLVDSRLDGATFYGAQLTSASLARADLEKADLRGATLNAANLDHADLQQALLWSAKLPGADLYGAKLQGALAIDADLRGADLREAVFTGTVMQDAKLAGADLDRSDLRGVLELTAAQVCSSKSRRGALLDDALDAQVTAQCGGLQ